MARQFITRERPYRRYLLQCLLWFSLSSLIFYLIIANSPVGNQITEWFVNVTSNLRSSFHFSSSPSTSSLKVNNTLTPEQMKPQILGDLTVETTSGPLRGFLQNVSGIAVHTYLSIPYGEPPVGKRRFRRTEPIAPWGPTVRDARHLPPPCIQSEYTQRLFPVHILNESISEDCLFLNIWSPAGSLGGAKRTNDSSMTKLKSVMLLIHGGLFTIGSTGIDEYDGRMLAAMGDVVVVTIQYRLGIFGFLDLDNEEIPGNMGLFDQLTALQWVSENAATFGGDPESITLFGTSAGSISIGFHMFSSRASSLFRRAILQSGSPMLLKNVYTRGEKVAEKFTSIVGCFERGNDSVGIYDTDDRETIVDCLDGLPFETLYKAQDTLVDGNPVPFMPTIPSEYVDDFIADYNESMALKQKEVLMGFNTNEGALILHASYPKLYTRTTVPQLRTLAEVQQRVLEMGVDSGLNEAQASSIATLLIRGQPRDTPTKWAQTVADLFSDMMFVCPLQEFAVKLNSYNVRTFMYLFGQRAANVEWGEWMTVTHHDEVAFIMGYPLRYPQLYSEDDVAISRLMIRTWTHFAKTGEIPANEYPDNWTPYDSVSKSYMQIQAGATRLGRNFHNESCDLYNLLAEYMN